MTRTQKAVTKTEGICDHANKLVEAPEKSLSPEQRWCGIWLRCPHCSYSLLIMSEELKDFLASQRAKLAQQSF
jgi:hypothetical protein